MLIILTFDPSKVVFKIDDFFNKKIFQENQPFSGSTNINFNYIPYKIYRKLDEKSKELVETARNDPQKMFVIGKSFVEGRDNFPPNTEIGINYLTESLNKDCIDSLVYYCEMLIKGKIVVRDLETAKELIQTKLNKKRRSIFIINWENFQERK